MRGDSRSAKKAVAGPEGSTSLTLPDTLGVERWWGIVFFALAACEPEPRGPVQVAQPEAMRFDTEAIRREVDHYKDSPTAEARRRMEQAFGALDARIGGLEALAQSQTGEERTATEQQVADLKHRREIHWTRAQTALAETQTIARAEPVAERVAKPERANSSQRDRRTERTRAMGSQQTTRTQPRNTPLDFFQRFFR